MIGWENAGGLCWDLAKFNQLIFMQGQRALVLWRPDPGGPWVGVKFLWCVFEISLWSKTWICKTTLVHPRVWTYSLTKQIRRASECTTTMRMRRPWSLTFELQNQLIFKTEKTSRCIFRYGVFFRKGGKNQRLHLSAAGTEPQPCDRWKHSVVCATYIFRVSPSCSDEVADCVLTVWLCGECGCLSFLLLRTNASSRYHFYVWLHLWKGEVVHFCWFVEHKENSSLQFRVLGIEKGENITDLVPSRNLFKYLKKENFYLNCSKVCCQHFILGERYIQGFLFYLSNTFIT